MEDSKWWAGLISSASRTTPQSQFLPAKIFIWIWRRVNLLPARHKESPRHCPQPCLREATSRPLTSGGRWRTELECGGKYLKASQISGLTEHGKNCRSWKLLSVPHVSLNCRECWSSRKTEHYGAEGLTKVQWGFGGWMIWGKVWSVTTARIWIRVCD